MSAQLSTWSETMIRLFFRLPWFIYLLLGFLAVGVGFTSFTSANKYNSARAVALAGDMPALIDAGEVTKSSFSDADEINVGAQISDKIFTVSVSGRRTIDKEKTAIFAFPENSESNSDQVNVVFMLDPKQSIEDFVGKFATGESGVHSVKLQVNGVNYDAGRKLGRVVDDAASQAGLQLGSNVQYVEPFMQSRQAGLKVRHPKENFMIFAGLGTLLGGLGIFKFLRKPKRAVVAQADV